ncbi:hypothetical protein J056_003096 [Wallemia ichthyophaga EXF-994]|uniref:Uncharacterized protein n=1 Tax=Wallemia ichthyophaga (strain EXF-994 / CBS 113033) TaxID=1299270 RepID=R9AN45_WALI9|nr:uncharacterized protein J056_003096 [Wallemia ichthyophaga EXF-994]EOR03639.1 hypothetical protein J056_003096 [Wallemia ichthyophaga EXF-994]
MIQTRGFSVARRVNKSHSAQSLIQPVPLSSIDTQTIPTSYTKQPNHSNYRRNGLVDEFIQLQSINALPSNLLVRRDGGRVANDGIKSDVRRDLKKVMRNL